MADTSKNGIIGGLLPIPFLLRVAKWLEYQEKAKKQRRPYGFLTERKPKPLDGYRDMLKSVAVEVRNG